MEKMMWDLGVGISEDGYICISQKDGYMQDDTNILVHPDQVDILTKWLNEAKEKLQNI